MSLLNKTRAAWEDAQPRADLPSPAAAGAGGPVRLLRPLLGVRKRQLEAYCRERGLSWAEDATNSDTRFLRNLLRQRLAAAPGPSDRSCGDIVADVMRLTVACQAARTALEAQSRALLAAAVKPAERGDGGGVILNLGVFAAAGRSVGVRALAALLQVPPASLHATLQQGGLRLQTLSLRSKEKHCRKTLLRNSRMRCLPFHFTKYFSPIQLQ